MSVCHTRALCQFVTTKRCTADFFHTTRCSFLATPPIPSEICARSDPPPFEKRLRLISAYNVATVRDRERSSILTDGKSATSYRWSAYLPRRPKSQTGGSKCDFCGVFFDEIQFQSNKVCHKVSLCENFRRQGITIPPCNDPSARNVTFNLIGLFSLKANEPLEHALRGLCHS